MKKLPLFLIFLMVIDACSIFTLYYDYSVNAKNVGKKMIDDVEIESSSGFWHGTGYLSGNAMKGLGGLQSVPPDDIYTIIVERRNQMPIKKVIDLRDKVKKSFRGDMIFVIDDHNHISCELEPY
jgi:hypothetical protein